MHNDSTSTYWLASTPRTGFPPAEDRLEVDVAVVGGGITGLTAAFLLKRAGRKVAVIEARQVAAQVTGATTAKITSLHGLIYAHLARDFGEDAARLYGESQQAALEMIASLVAERKIDCGFERLPGYTYSENQSKLDLLSEEAETASRLGLPAEFVTEAPAPMPLAGAVRFKDQAQFHPRKYLLDIANDIPGEGSHVFEGSRVVDIEEDEPCRVKTDKGILCAKDVIVATCLPILDRGAFFTTAYPRYHPVLAARIGEDGAPKGMFLGIDQPGFSIRTHRDEKGLVAIVTGQGYKAGHADPKALVEKAEAQLRKYCSVRSIENRWTNLDYDSMDRMPFIGRLSSRNKHLWVATAFGAWGMTGGTLAAMILCDLLQEKANLWAELYDSTRLNATRSAPTFVKENLHVARMWIGDRVSSPPERDLESLSPGEGAVVSTEDGKLAVSRNGDGSLTAVSATCTHMGCTVVWNGVSKTWDCPCHGSRFESDGRVVFGPAVKPLEARAVPGAAKARKAS